MFSLNLSAQNFHAKIARDTILIGDQTELTLTVESPEKSTVIWANFKDTLTKSIEITSQKNDTVASQTAGYINYLKRLTITSFDTGAHFIPPIKVGIKSGNSRNITNLYSDTLFFYVNNVAVDTTKAIRDIKPIQSAPLTFKEVAPYIAALLGLVALIALVFYYFKRKKQNKPLIPLKKKIEIPAWQEALENIKLLRKEKLHTQGKHKEFYTKLTEIFRLYIEKQFGIEANEMISSEIVEACYEKDIDSELIKNIENVLQKADLVKFAKHQPLDFENEQSISVVENFVLQTKPAEIQSDTENNENQNSK